MEDISKRKDLNSYASADFLQRMSKLPIKFGVGTSISASAGFIDAVSDLGKYQSLHILDFISKIKSGIANGEFRYSQFIRISDSMRPVEPTSILVVLSPFGYAVKMGYPHGTDKQEEANRAKEDNKVKNP